MPAMSDSAHTLVYKRFLEITAASLPGLALFLIVGEFFLWLLGDAIELEWGWAVGISAIICSVTLVVWLFVGMFLRGWAETKSTGVLIGVNVAGIIGVLVAGGVFLAFVAEAAAEIEAAEAAAARGRAEVVLVSHDPLV